MPDILHWLGITKVDRMLSMSNMKHDAIVEQGIPIHERVPIPDGMFQIVLMIYLAHERMCVLMLDIDMIPEDSRVEIDAKIHSGYFTTGKQLTEEDLKQVKGRGWESWEDVTVCSIIRIFMHPNG
jgi:hypothetical protein